MNFLITTFWILLYIFGILGWISFIFLPDYKFKFKKIAITLIAIAWVLSVSFVAQFIYRSLATTGISTERGEFKSHGVRYNFKEEYCRSECRYMLKDLSDTWGNNTNNQDSISKTMMECYRDCVKTN